MLEIRKSLSISAFPAKTVYSAIIEYQGSMSIFKKVTLLSVFLFVIITSAKSQQYIDALGIRIGESYGLTYKHFFNEKLAVEASLLSRWHGISSMGLLEWNYPLVDIRGLNWYLGAGPGFGYWTYNNATKWLDPGKSVFTGGIIAIAGLEYNLKEVPLAIGLDWKPVINLIGYSKPWLDEFSLSFKFRLN